MSYVDGRLNSDPRPGVLTVTREAPDASYVQWRQRDAPDEPQRNEVDVRASFVLEQVGFLIGEISSQ